MQTEMLITLGVQKPYSPAVGQDIGAAEGARMIQRYHEMYPDQPEKGHFIGRNIIEQILAQPGCIGIKTYYAMSHLGQRQLVLIGVDAQGNDILSFSRVNAQGQMEQEKGIVADRLLPTTSNPTQDDYEAWIRWMMGL